jgi:tape measure domain-containing protein
MSDALIIPVDSSQVEKGKRSLADLAAQSKKTEQSIGGLDKANDKASSSLSSIAGGAKLAAFGLAGVGASIVAVGSAVLSTSINFEKLNNSLKFSTGSAAGAAKELEYLKNTTNALGLDFLTTAQAYAKFSAASKGTALEGQKTRDVFESIAKASTVLGLSADETSGALKAIEQIMSKGTVSAEELRGQLGERLPGAFNIAARAMGVTTQELGKMLEQGQLVSNVFLPKFAAELTKTLGDSPDSAAGSAQAQLNRLSNAWLDFKKVIADSGVINIVVKVVEGTSGALKFLTNGLSDITGNKQYQKTKLGQLLDLQSSNNYSFYSKKDIESQIFKLRDSLGISQQFKANIAGANADFSIAPDFGVTKKDGQGGYDARLNNQKQIDDDFERQKKRNKELYDAKIKEIQDQFRFLDDIEESSIKKQFDDNQDLLKEKLKAEKELEKEKLETQKKWFDLEEDRIKEAQKLREDALEQIARKEEEMSRDINKSLTDALLRGFEKGNSFSKNFIETLKNMFKTLVLQPTINFLLQPISQGVSSIVSSLFNGGTSGSSSGLNLLGAGSSIMDLVRGGNSAIVSSIESLGTFLSTGTGGLGDILGGAIGQYSGAISNALPFAGAAFSLLTGDVKGALGSALGAALTFTPLGPVGGIVGSLLGSALGGLFGGKSLADTPRYASGVSTIYENGKLSSINNSYKQRAAGGNDSLKALNENFAKSLGTLFDAFGESTKITVGSVLNKKNNSSGGISTQFDGLSLATNTGSIKKGSLQQAFDALVEKSLGSFLVTAINKSSLADGVKKFFDGLTKKEDVADAINTLASLNYALKDLPPVFDAIRNAIDTTAYQTSISDLKARFTAIGTYTSLFYTQEEQFSTFTKQLTSQFDALGEAIPKSRDEFRKMVDGIKVTDESTSNLFNGLVALAPAMDAFFKQVEALKGATKRTIDSFTSLAEYRAYVGVANNYGDAFASDFTANTRTGAISVNSSGQANVNGNTEVASLLKELRDLTKQLLTQSSDGTGLLQRFDRVGMPSRAA